MNFHVLTLFPEMIEQGMNTSIIGRAITGGYLSVEAINIRLRGALARKRGEEPVKLRKDIPS